MRRYFVFHVYARKRRYDGGPSLGDPAGGESQRQEEEWIREGVNEGGAVCDGGTQRKKESNARFY